MPVSALVAHVGVDQFDQARQTGTIPTIPRPSPLPAWRALAISNERILSNKHDQVQIRVRDKRLGHKRTVTLPISEFIGRFMRHVFPVGFKCIRHHGLLATVHKLVRFVAARTALAVPEPQAAIEAAHAFLPRVAGHDPSRGPHYTNGHWRTVAVLPPAPRAAMAHRDTFRPPISICH